MKHVRTCCRGCKEPMRLLAEMIILSIRERLYRCPVCRQELWRYYDLHTTRYYPTFVDAVNGQIWAEIVAEQKVLAHA